MHLPDYFGPNRWTKLTLGELGWKKHFSSWVWLSGSNGISAEAHTTIKTWKTRDSMIRYHMGEEEEMHLSQLNFFCSISSQIFFPRTYREVRLGRETEDTADTSSTSISLIHCRVPSRRQMSLSNVRIDQCKSVTIVLHQLSLHTEKPWGELKAFCKQPEGKRYFWWQAGGI